MIGHTFECQHLSHWHVFETKTILTFYRDTLAARAKMAEILACCLKHTPYCQLSIFRGRTSQGS